MIRRGAVTVRLPRVLLLLGMASSALCGGGACSSHPPGRGDAAATDTASTEDSRPPDAGDASATRDGPGAIDAAVRDIRDRLRDVAGLTVTETLCSVAVARCFLLTYDQPVDHDQPEGQRFAQSMTLVHRSDDAPMVLASTGYSLWNTMELDEPALLLTANQLTVEHRFFGTSRPEPADFTKLTIRQAAADHHRIVQALRPIYAGRWISTGHSKGGMTSVYHRRFYPDDVDGTIAYVAPLSLGIEDPRYLTFLEEVGTDPACRARLESLQRRALELRSDLVARMDALATTGVRFDILTSDRALEFAVLETPFLFWQYTGQGGCAGIPGDGATVGEIDSFLHTEGQLESYDDEWVTMFRPYYYQSGTELGGPAIKVTHLADLIRYGVDTPDRYSPELASATFDPQVMLDIEGWVETEGARLMFVYGGVDPWTAGAFALGSASDSYRYVVSGGTHLSGIADLAPLEQAEAVDTLRCWAGLAPAGAPPAWRSRADLLRGVVRGFRL
jgi:hypothetical protein